MSKPLHDRELVRLLQHFNDGSAQSECYARVIGPVTRFIQKRTGWEREAYEEIAQDAVTIGIRKICQGKYEYQEGKALVSYFIGIAKWCIQDARRYRSRRPSIAGHEFDPDRWVDHTQEDEDFKLLKWAVDEIIASLNPKQQIAIRMRADGYATEEIAEYLGMSKGAVDKLIFDVRVVLKRSRGLL